MYNGELKKGIVFFLVIFPVYFLLAYFTIQTFGGLMVSALCIFIYKVAVAVEAYRAAKKTENFVPKSYNQPLWLIAYTVVALIFIDQGIKLSRSLLGYQAYSIPTVSMEPSIKEGDEIIVRRSVEFQPGDIIAFKDEHDVPLISRIVAMARDTIAITGDEISYPIPEKTKHIGTLKQDVFEYNLYESQLPNGRQIDIQKIMSANNYSIGETPYSVFDTMVVPDHTVFVLGDNRGNSVDSRIYGPVPIDRIIGIARYVYWSQDIGRLGTKL